MPNQYENDANFLAHYESTGPEIWKQTEGGLTHFLTGCGTGGTITGIATFLKEKNEKVKIIAIQAQKNHLLQGMRNFEESAMPDLFLRRQKIVDEWLTATNEESFRLVKELAVRERLLVGPSSGSVMASMVKVAEKLERGNIVGIFADDGTKFKSLYDQQGVFTDTEYYEVLKNAKNLSKPAYAFV
jgi:cysteine synthase B